MPQAGNIVSAYALGVVVGAPVLTGIGARIPHKRLLLLLSGLFVIGNVASALAPNFGLLFAARFLAGLPHGALFGVGAVARGMSFRLPKPALTLALGGGMVDMLANAAYLVAAREGPLSLVVTLSSLYPASTVLLARVVLGERLNTRQPGGVVCALVAIVLIVKGG